MQAARIARDVEAMLADGELDRAVYCSEDLRTAAADAPGDVARELDVLGDAFARERLGEAKSATRRLLSLLASP